MSIPKSIDVARVMQYVNWPFWGTRAHQELGRWTTESGREIVGQWTNQDGLTRIHRRLVAGHVKINSVHYVTSFAHVSVCPRQELCLLLRTYLIYGSGLL